VFRNEQSQEFTYTTRWDSDKIKGCQCDYPATGYDCSQQLCPPGDDPLTPGQVGFMVTELEFVKRFLCAEPLLEGSIFFTA
jgi:hypothetical protein